MRLYDSKLWLSDIDETIENLPDINELAGKSLLITGCSGLICSTIIDVIVHWNRTHNEKIKILAAGRNEKKINQRFDPYYKEEWFAFLSYDACSIETIVSCPCDYIIHGASNASPNKIVEEPVETMLSNFLGMRVLLEQAKSNWTERVLYISSSEIYGRKEGNQPYKTNDYGYIDLLNARNSYSIGKRAAETLCASYAAEYGVDSVIVRPGHIYGPTAVESDNRVASAWAYDVARGKDIVLKSDGSQIRSYCYCLDGASAIFKVLLKGKSNNAYNISNPNSIITVRRLAEILAECAGVQVRMELPSEIEKKGFNPMDNSSLDSSALEKLGWRGLFNAERGLHHTVSIIRGDV